MMMLAMVVATLLAAPVQLLLADGSKLFIEGDSSLHAWKCEAAKFDAAGEAGTPAAPFASLTAFELSVPVAQIRCDGDTMEGKLRDALKAEKHPRIDYTFTSLAGAQVVGKLAIGGVEKTVTV